MYKNVWRLFCVVLCLSLLLGLLSGCGGGSSSAPVHNPIADEDEIYGVLEGHDFWFYLEGGEPDWYGSTTDGQRVDYAGELISMFSALGYDLSAYDSGSFAQAINDYYDEDKSLSIFGTACTVLGIDGSRYATIYATYAPEASSEPTLGGYEADLAGTWYHSNGATLTFDGLGSASLDGGDGTLELSYTYDGETILLFYPDAPEDIMEGLMDAEGDIQIDGVEGWFLRTPTGYTQSDGDFDYTNYGDGTALYVDNTRNVRFNCPVWMTVLTEGIGETTDAVLVTDNLDGYVISDNLSGEWEAYPGSADDFLSDYFADYFDEFFPPLYGEWSGGEADIVDLSDVDYQHLLQLDGSDSWMAAISGNYWNDAYDIDFLFVAFNTDAGRTMVKGVLLPLGAEESQLLSLCNEVTNIDSVR